jgi:hypothetical protein
MNDARKLVFDLLTSEALTMEDVQAFARWAQGPGLRRLLDDAITVRRVSERYARPADQSARSEHRDAPESARPPQRVAMVSQLEQEVERLLIGEAKLTSSDAQQLLATRLGYGPIPQKKALREIVRRLSVRYAPSAVLSAAHQIRNERVHSSGSVDWRLDR